MKVFFFNALLNLKTFFVVNSNIKKKESLFNSNAASFHIQKPLSVPLNNFPSQIIKKPPGLLFNSVRSKNLVYQPSNKKNYSMMSSESTHDSENVTNTLTSSNSGHLENFASLTLGKSDLNSSGKLDSSIGFCQFLKL